MSSADEQGNPSGAAAASTSTRDSSALFINPDLPIFPGRGGIEFLHSTGFARILDRVGLVSLLHNEDQRSKIDSLRSAGLRLYLWENAAPETVVTTRAASGSLIRRLGKLVYQQLRCGLSRPTDTLIQDYQFRNLADPLMDALREASWQAAITVQSSCAHWHQFLPRSPVTVLMMHDVRALMFERKSRSEETLVGRLIARLEAARYRSYEAKHLKAYDLVVAVSEADAQWISERYPAQRLLTLPIPVDPHYFSPGDHSVEVRNRVVFPGMMNHPPNVDAAQYFARDVLPLIRQHLPDAELWVVGRDPTPAVVRLGRLPGVHVTGSVPDIRPYLSQASIIVVPLRYGSGMRQKILEAWGMERCVVSTTIGAEGLKYANGENLVIADGSDAMAKACQKLLLDKRLRDQIRTGGRRVILKYHNPAKLTSDYCASIESIAASKKTADPPMSVYVDLRWMYPGRAGGIETLARSFVGELSHLDRHNHYLIEAPTEVLDDFQFPCDSRIRIRATDSLPGKARRFSARASRAVRRRLSIDVWRTPAVDLLTSAREKGAEVALSIPGYLSPDVELLPNVLVVPDIQHEYHPEFFSAEHLEERRRLYTASIHRADHLCAISEFTRQTLIERLDVPPEKISTTHLAAHPRFRPGRPEKILRQYDLAPGSYLFFPGHSWPHKNHVGAVESLALVHERTDLRPLLVLTGNPREAQPALLSAIESAGLRDCVRFLGFCPPEHMPSLYQGAVGLLLPSLFEGFGMPVLEAMRCGCPVICSNTTSLPEVAGEAALLVNPLSTEQIADAIESLLTDEVIRNRLIHGGHMQATKFSWRKFTLQIIQALHQVRQARFGSERTI